MRKIRAVKVRSLAVAMAVSVALSPTIGFRPFAPVYADDESDLEELKKQQSDLEEKETAAQQDLAAAQEKVNKVRATVKELDGQLTSTEAEIRRLDGAISENLSLLEKTRVELESAEEQEAVWYQKLKLRLKAIYESGQVNYLEVVLRAESMSELFSKAEYSKEMAAYDREILENLTTARTTVQEKEQTIVEEEALLEQNRSDQETQKEALQQIKAAKEQELNSLKEDAAALELYLTQLEEQRNQVSSDIYSTSQRMEEARRAAQEEAEREQLEEEEARRRAEEEARRIAEEEEARRKAEEESSQAAESSESSESSEESSEPEETEPESSEESVESSEESSESSVEESSEESSESSVEESSEESSESSVEESSEESSVEESSEENSESSVEESSEESSESSVEESSEESSYEESEESYEESEDTSETETETQPEEEPEETPVYSFSLSWPLPGYSHLTTYFGEPDYIYGLPHRGIDIAAPSGTPIVAAAGGTVITAGWNDSYGNYVAISHGDGIVTLYAHASELCCSAGDSVSAGTTIALVGTTGDSLGNHLHFEVQVNGSLVNPLDYTSP